MIFIFSGCRYQEKLDSTTWQAQIGSSTDCDGLQRRERSDGRAGRGELLATDKAIFRCCKIVVNKIMDTKLFGTT